MTYQIKTLTQEELDAILDPVDAQRNASDGFERLAVGNPPTPRTPLYKDKSPEWILDTWTSVLDQEFDENEVLRPLITYDKSRTSKYGPQGGYPPFDDRVDEFEDYYNHQDTVPVDAPLDQVVINSVQQVAFNLNGRADRRAISPNRVVEEDKRNGKLYTNSGCRDYTRRSIPQVIANALAALKDGSMWEFPMITGSRSQRGKPRFIFMAPFSLNIHEKTFLYPMMDRIRQVGDSFFSAWEGFSEVDKALYREGFFDEGNTYVQQDFTTMDKFVNQLQMKIVKLICRGFFQKEAAEAFERVVDHALNIPLMTEIQKEWTGLHGMPSGSGMTNFCETLINLYIMLRYEAMGLKIVAKAGLGDDGIFAIKRNGMSDEEILDVMQVGAGEVGQVLNPAKQGIDEHTVVYLQRFYDDRIPRSNGMVLGMYPSILALNTAVFPERRHDPRKWSGEMEILRWIMILENCKNLPYFYKLVLFFVKGCKFGLGTKIPGFFNKLPSLYEDSKAIKGFVPSYNQEGLERGIDNFETVKILQTMAVQA